MGILDRFSKKGNEPGPHEKPTSVTHENQPSPGAEKRTLLITGDWLNQVWKKKPVRVFAEADAAKEFLSQDVLPYLWDDEQRYIDSVNHKPDPQRELRVAWTAAYLNHPEPVVIRQTLRDHKFAARGEFYRQGEAIVKVLRKHCPAERKRFFEDQVFEVFGPSLSERDAPKAAGEVKFKVKENKRGPMGILRTYEVHTAESKADALGYLEKRPVTEANYYVCRRQSKGSQKRQQWRRAENA